MSRERELKWKRALSAFDHPSIHCTFKHTTMLIRWRTLALVCLLELALLAAAHGDHAHAHDGNPDDGMSELLDESVPMSHVQPSHAGGHSHMHAGAPKTVLNEVSPAFQVTIA